MTLQLESVLCPRSTNLYGRKFHLSFRKYDNCVCSSFAVARLKKGKHQRPILVSFQDSGNLNQNSKQLKRNVVNNQWKKELQRLLTISQSFLIFLGNRLNILSGSVLSCSKIKLISNKILVFQFLVPKKASKKHISTMLCEKIGLFQQLETQ